jgi:hypothetical protein
MSTKMLTLRARIDDYVVYRIESPRLRLGRPWFGMKYFTVVHRDIVDVVDGERSTVENSTYYLGLGIRLTKSTIWSRSVPVSYDASRPTSLPT